MPQSPETLDKYSPIPLYHQVRQALERLIQQGIYGPGQAVPAEAELSRMFEVSRITVRQAIAEMIEEGLLYRPRPRGRLHVSPPRVHQRLMRLRGFFTDDMLTAGLAPRTVVLAVDTVQGERVAAHLGCAPDAPIFRVERRHEGNGEPLALQTSYVPAAVCPDLDHRDLSQSLFRMIEETYHKPIIRAVQHIRVREATRHESQQLRLPPRAYALQVDRTSYADDATAVEYYTCALRADRYDFTMELDRQARADSEALDRQAARSAIATTAPIADGGASKSPAAVYSDGLGVGPVTPTG